MQGRHHVIPARADFKYLPLNEEELKLKILARSMRKSQCQRHYPLCHRCFHKILADLTQSSFSQSSAIYINISTIILDWWHPKFAELKISKGFRMIEVNLPLGSILFDFRKVD